MQCPGGDVILVASGHWRPSNVSSLVVACPRAASCHANDTCAEGHTGVVCGACTQGFALALPFKCAKCESKVTAVLVFLASLVVLLLVTGFAIFLTTKSNHDAILELGKVPSHPCAGDILKLLALFLQYLALLGTLPVPFPRALLGLMATANVLFAGTTTASVPWLASPFECVVQGSRLPSAVVKLIASLSMPLAVAIIEFVVFMLIKTCSRRGKNKERLYFSVVFLVSAFFTMPGWIRAVFSFFNCFSIEDSSLPHSLYWVPSMADACYVGYHRAWALGLGLPCLLLCCALPAGIVLGLRSNRKRMLEPGFCGRFAHLYCLYTPRAYWWESILLSQTIVYVALTVWAPQIGASTAVLLVGLHLSIAAHILHYVRPYAAPLLHNIHVAALGCLLLDVFVALLMFQQPVSPSRAWAMGAGQAAAAVVALVVNVGFVVTCCVCVWICFFKSQGFDKVRRLLAGALGMSRLSAGA